MLQSISSVFVVYRRKTLTGSPHPTYANGTDKPCNWIQWKNICHHSKRAQTCQLVRDQDAITLSARHTWQTWCLNSAQSMLQWFISFPELAEFTEFNESSVPFRKISNVNAIDTNDIIDTFWTAVLRHLHYKKQISLFTRRDLSHSIRNNMMWLYRKWA